MWSPIFILEMWSTDPKEEFKPWCFLTNDRKCPNFRFDVIMTSQGKNYDSMFKYGHIIHQSSANLMLIQIHNRIIPRKWIFEPEIAIQCWKWVFYKTWSNMVILYIILQQIWCWFRFTIETYPGNEYLGRK